MVLSVSHPKLSERADAEGRLEISKELARLLAKQTEFFKKGARCGHTPDELREYERSRARVRELFESARATEKNRLAKVVRSCSWVASGWVCRGRRPSTD